MPTLGVRCKIRMPSDCCVRSGVVFCHHKETSLKMTASAEEHSKTSSFTHPNYPSRQKDVTGDLKAQCFARNTASSPLLDPAPGPNQLAVQRATQHTTTPRPKPELRLLLCGVPGGLLSWVQPTRRHAGFVFGLQKTFRACFHGSWGPSGSVQ